MPGYGAQHSLSVRCTPDLISGTDRSGARGTPVLHQQVSVRCTIRNVPCTGTSLSPHSDIRIYPASRHECYRTLDPSPLPEVERRGSKRDTGYPYLGLFLARPVGIHGVHIQLHIVCNASFESRTAVSNSAPTRLSLKLRVAQPPA